MTTPAAKTTTTRTKAPAGTTPAAEQSTAAKTEKPTPAVKLLDPRGPHTFAWALRGDSDPRLYAVGVKFTYRLTAGVEGGWFASLKTTVGGKWVGVAGRCDTIEQAKELAGYVERGSMWLTYSKWIQIPYPAVIANHTALVVSK